MAERESSRVADACARGFGPVRGPLGDQRQHLHVQAVSEAPHSLGATPHGRQSSSADRSA